MTSRLVFDIGLCDGEDSRYYLDLGYSVVGVEANPHLAEQCRLRFAQEIAQNRMKVVNVGILQQQGSFTFYRDLANDEKSSFVWINQDTKDWEEMTIPCITTRDLIAEYGKPFFMKVDIEGADLQALATLTPDTCPTYLSLELGSDGMEIMDRLLELGYSRFKFVEGRTHWCSLSILPNEFGWRFLRKIGRIAPFIRSGIQRLPQRFHNRTEWDPTEDFIYNPDHFHPGGCWSGPFGEKASGFWRGAASARSFIKKLAKDSLAESYGGFIWWDIHARHASFKVKA